ncbi:hypothetical protein [Georgenia alba]|uniref:DUF2127 domain-containing protein n=1 Tax=Georgenia alba TaxID=2233858 RepID=A0ABW2Q8P0_9MICO
MSDPNDPQRQPGEPEPPRFGQRLPPEGPPRYGAQDGPGGGPDASGPAGPGGAGPGEDGPAALERPRPLRLAVILMYVGAVMSLFDTIAASTTRDAQRQMAEQVATEQGAPGLAGQMADFVFTVSVAVPLIAVLLWVWMAVKNGQGRSWARVVATVFGGLAVVGFLFSIGQQTALPAQLAFGVLRLLLAVSILVLLWNRESTEYYEAVSARRRA